MAAAAIPYAITGLSALAGLLSGRKKTQETKSTTNTHQDFFNTGSSVSTPTYDSIGEALKSRLAQVYMNQLNADPGELADSMITQKLQGLNAGSAIARKVAASTMGARGLSYSPAAAKVVSDIDTQRIGKGVDLINSRDQLMEELINQRLASASNFFRSLPYGQNTQTASTGSQSGTQESQGTATTPGDPWGSMFGSLTSTLAGLYGMGAFGKNQSSQVNSPLTSINNAANNVIFDPATGKWKQG